MKMIAFRCTVAWLSARFCRDQRGTSVVEFAMLLPAMVTLYLGTFEISQGVGAERKVTLTARTAAVPRVAGAEHQQQRHEQHAQCGTSGYRAV
jgi:Flp pilus assembly protein TadG